MDEPHFDDVDEEIRIARALRTSVMAEWDSLMALSPEQRARVLVRVETILDLIADLERLKSLRQALLQSRRSKSKPRRH